MSNLNSLKKSELIALVEQLERNAEDDRRRIGVMMYDHNTSCANLQAQIDELESEVDELQTKLSIAVDELSTTSSIADEFEAQLVEVDSLLESLCPDLSTEGDEHEYRMAAIRELANSKTAPTAAQPKTAPPAAPKTPSPKPSVPAQVIASPEAQEAMAKLLKLTKEQRSAVIKHSGFKLVNLSNVLEVQAKWHSRKSA